MKTVFKAGLAAALAVSAMVFAAPEPARADAEYKLRFSDFGPPRGSRPEAMMWWADQIKERTGGRVEIEFFWSQSLIKAKETMKAVGAGLVETGTIMGLYTPAELPVWNVANTPFLFRDNWIGMRAMADLRKARPELDAETEKQGVKALVNFTTGPAQILMVNDAVLSSADLVGKKIRASGGWATLIKQLGATPVNIGFGEVYQALERGTIDGTLDYTVAVKAYKHAEVAHHLTLANMGQVLGYGIAINLRLWNKMPDDIKQVILDVSDETHEHLAKLQYVLAENVIKELKAGEDGLDVTVYDLPAEVAAEWEGASGQFLEGWKADMAKRGVDGEAILAELVALRDKYRAELADKGYPWDR